MSRRKGQAIDPTVLEAAVTRSVSMAGLLRQLGLPDCMSSRRRVLRRIEETGLTIHHFKGQAHSRGTVSPRRKKAADILKRLEPGTPRQKTLLLHRALAEVGMPYLCGRCGVGSLWIGQRLVLEIDHVNGDRLDNRRENLRYLCPNCHAQTPTYGRAGARPTDH